MKTSLTLACLAISLTIPVVEAYSQQVLEKGVRHDERLGKDSPITYYIELDKDEFVYAEVFQHNVDAKATVFDERGEPVGSFSAAKRGAEPIQFETSSSGRFRLEITAADSGSVSVELQRIEPVAANPVERLDQLLSAYKGEDTPGAIVAVIEDGAVSHFQSVGSANLTHSIPFRRSTLSNIGSVSKQFTAFAVMSLSADDSISLDDDVRTYFPELPDLGQTVKVRHLLNHTSGYREFLNLLAMAGVRLGDGDYIDRGELLRILQKQPELQEAPGTKYNYNNTAYALAALLVERVTEEPFPQWIAENVFGPLGMTNTFVRSHLGEIIPGAADGYLYADESPFRLATDLGGGGGAAIGPGAIYTTIDDFAKWVDNLGSGALGGKTIIDEMMSPQIDSPGKDSHYGFGFSLVRHRGLKLVQHGGADTAHRASMLYYPEINAGIVAMSNNGAFPSSTIARKTAEAFFRVHMEQAAVPDHVSKDGEVSERETASLDTFDPFLGKYELDDFPGTIVTVSRQGQQIHVQIGSGEPTVASPVARHKLSIPPEASIVFNVDADGTAGSLTLTTTNDYRARRLEDWVPDASALEEYVGLYYSTELETFYEVKSKDDKLVVKRRRMDDIKLSPKTVDSFTGVFPVADIVFVRDEANRIDGMLLSNTRTRNVKFDLQR